MVASDYNDNILKTRYETNIARVTSAQIIINERTNIRQIDERELEERRRIEQREFEERLARLERERIEEERREREERERREREIEEREMKIMKLEFDTELGYNIFKNKYKKVMNIVDYNIGINDESIPRFDYDKNIDFNIRDKTAEDIKKDLKDIIEKISENIGNNIEGKYIEFDKDEMRKYKLGRDRYIYDISDVLAFKLRCKNNGDRYTTIYAYNDQIIEVVRIMEQNYMYSKLFRNVDVKIMPIEEEGEEKLQLMLGINPEELKRMCKRTTTWKPEEIYHDFIEQYYILIEVLLNVHNMRIYNMQFNNEFFSFDMHIKYVYMFHYFIGNVRYSYEEALSGKFLAMHQRESTINKPHQANLRQQRIIKSYNL